MTGTVNKVTGYEQFSNDPNEQEGYYLPIKVEPWEGSQVRSSRNPERWTPLKDDGNVVLFLGKEAPDQVEWYEVKDADGTVTRRYVKVSAAETIAYKGRKAVKAKKTSIESDKEATKES